jgi:hypothetical protein
MHIFSLAPPTSGRYNFIGEFQVLNISPPGAPAGCWIEENPIHLHHPRKGFILASKFVLDQTEREKRSNKPAPEWRRT